jgi:hypothetical protein
MTPATAPTAVKNTTWQTCSRPPLQVQVSSRILIASKGGQGSEIMLRVITSSALRVDQALQRTFGRPYNALLAVVLVSEIVHQAWEFPEKLASKPRLIGVVLSVLIELALLIHQVGALDHHLARRSHSNSGEDAATTH